MSGRKVALGIALMLAIIQVRPADAQVSVDGGYFTTGGNGGSIGTAVSLALFKTPVVPLTVEATGAAALNGEGFATTLDLRFKLAGGTAIGGGVGIGNIASTQNTNIMYDGIVSQSLTPHLAVELRLYAGPFRPSSFFAGVRVTL